VIEYLSLVEGAVVLDPMNGSGTTTAVAQKNRMLGVGYDVNPAMVMIARGKDGTVDLEDVVETAERALDAPRSNGAEKPRPAMRGWIAPKVFEELKFIEAGIARAIARAPANLDPRLVAIHAPGAVRDYPSATESLLRAALLVTVRRLARPKGSSNPGWLKPRQARGAAARTVRETFLDVCSSMADDLKAEFDRSPDKRRPVVLVADATNQVPMRSGHADAVITSPPYLTRVDYPTSTAPELSFLGTEQDAFSRLRRQTMGSPCLPELLSRKLVPWGPVCGELLRAICAHPSKASSGYYFRYYDAYFVHAKRLVSEYLRVLKPGGAAVLVVQDSWYKDIHVPLAEIYVEMASSLGAEARVLSTERVVRHITQFNPRAKKYKKGDVHEHVVVINKPARQPSARARRPV
jgi:SAM-dependent methyltransferase